MWRFDFPQILFVLLIVPLLVYLLYYRKTRGGKISFNFSVWNSGHFRSETTPRRILLIITRALFWIGFSILVLAMAAPVIVEKQRKYLSRGLDLMLVLDVSPSMSARDVGTITRFDAAREVVRDFISGRENDAIGLVIFGAEASLRVPPTLDYAFVEQALDSVGVMDLGDGTAIGLGIAVAAVHLKDSSAEEKVIILITDGDNNAGDIDPDRAAEVASALRIRIYSIGIGSEGETTIQFIDPESGKEVRGVYQGKLNEELLKRIATVTGGRYFHSGTLGILNTIFQEIDSLESTVQEVAVFIERQPRHRMFILLGFSVILLCIFVNKLVIGELL
ncbi:MAG: VWA domain-containing protein [Spirochaetaceae bacterium]|nr:MAG: VWA domain-containing protein [Spirochaetaceae bacterium]